ncbi:antitoxin MazE family protein [Devosia rhizoryzae]|uniref:Antitoxin MazE family protein n=1 Tax=Devosia rhizoryzae TaxID=2774137 RepID=A0ABX7C5V6_9HYPH|nr:antitoxin MazE family protein [Devosia rhizoryzae]QQR38127.1 antitoxin MazE family protein [Devosia rhizoryzae]
MSQVAKRYTKAEEAAMRAAGLRPVTIWVPDVTRPGFAEESARQSRLAAEADRQDPTIDSFLEAAWREMDEEISRSET